MQLNRGNTVNPVNQQHDATLSPLARRSHGEIGEAAAVELFNNEAFLARMDKAVDAAKALPMDQTPAYHRALDAQVQEQNRGGKA
jgi:hypothetical protein